MKKEFKAVYESIRPDEELLMSALDLTDKKAPKSKHIVKRVISCVLCLAVFAGAGIGLKDNFIKHESDTVPSQLVSQPMKSSSGSLIGKGSVMVAYAQTNDVVRLDDDLKLSEMPLFGNITIIDLNAPKSEIDEKNAYLENIKKDIEAEFERMGNEGKGIELRQGCVPLENVRIRRIFMGEFLLDLPDDYSEIEKLKIYNTSEYADVVLSINTDTGDDFSVKHRHSNYVEATGQELKFSKDSGLFEKGLGEYEMNPGYQITWNTSYEFSQAVEANPEFDITAFKDEITFEVVYKNGDVSKAKANISFDENGNMAVANGGFDYISA